MAAYNWLEFEKHCPVCLDLSVIRGQFHIASEYGGSGDFRFHDAVYALGQRVAWWEKNDLRYSKWKTSNKIEIVDNDSKEEFECCYSQCLSCKYSLYTIVKFVECVPIEVTEVGREEDWPDSYLK